MTGVVARLRPLLAPCLTGLEGVSHGFFTRQGGVSGGIYGSLNCGFGSRDDRAAVAENRRLVAAALGAADGVSTVHQVHGVAVAVLREPWTPEAAPKADAIVTSAPGAVIGVLTADCAPVLLADPVAGVIGAAHAGWRGALAGVVEAAVQAMIGLGARPERIRAGVGPCIGPDSYEVRLDFKETFLESDRANDVFFQLVDKPGHALFDLPGYVRSRLARLGLAGVDGLDLDTLTDPDRFFSYRRSCLHGEPDYGRMVSAITLTPVTDR